MTPQDNSHRRNSKLAIFFALVSWILISPYSVAASNGELKGVKNEISRQQQSLQQQQKQLDQLQSSLKQQELSINQAEKAIKQTQQQLSASKQNISQLNQSVTKLEKQQSEQSSKLAQLLKTYYVTHRGNTASPFLRDNDDQDRISHYFQHLAAKRAKTIAELEKTHNALNHDRQQLELEKQQLDQLLAGQIKQRDQLKQAQSSRKSTVGKIRKSITSDKVYLAELQRNETRLKAEIAKAAKRNAVPMDGLASQKGKLAWPLKGNVVHRYGSRQTGQINWKGMVISARYGQAVKSVYSGTVVFADYLRGYGLVVLLDHGRGDMTLYGFNQSLLKKEGDKVAAGETIALAGDTGGQSQPSLYFEIRRNSKTQNPSQWLTR
ncbi:murein hydrolase activator EnvC family protein [Vibrio sp.]|uniref:murein hydrolase activator EnvC family protein n=1 Tax=Vibrio sp. TaxID=678 RepID=UPI003D0D7178